MLFYAIGEKCISASLAQKGVTYQCPECKGPIRLRGGHQRQKHFYHLSSQIKCRQNGKSPTHLKIQEILAQQFPSSIIENPFPEISRIADLFCPLQKMVIEVQCSFLSVEEIESRNRDYASLGLFVLWIFHEKRFSPRKTLFTFPHFFTNIQQNRNGVIYDFWREQKFPVDLTSPIEVRFLRKLPFFLQLRYQRWQKAFKGDLTHLFISKNLPRTRFNWSYRSLFHKILKQFTK